MHQFTFLATALLFLGPLGSSAFANDSQGAPPDLELCALVSDGMVLQRERVVPVWGWGQPGAAVLVTPSWSGHSTRAFVEGDGSWRLRLATPTAGGPFSIRFEMNGDEIVVEDVMVGEVWLASGQSNMEWTISGSASVMTDFEGQRERIHQPNLRFFDVPNRISMEPEIRLEGKWAPINPDTWPFASAVAYYFADELQSRLGVPIGIIASDWGGTVAESWTSEATLRAEFPEFAPSLDRIARDRIEGPGEDSLDTLQAAWWAHLAEVDPGTELDWSSAPTDEWRAMDLPSAWEDQGLDVDGVVWFRRDVDLSAAWVNRELLLELGAIDDMDTTFWDGTRIGGMEGSGSWRDARHYSIPAELATQGLHTIAIRVVDTGGAGGITGANGPLRLSTSDDKNRESIALDGPWKFSVGASAKELGAWPRHGWFHQNRPTALFNGMIAPLVGYGIRGVIWYQGESNVGRPSQYERLFPAMIRDWRRQFAQGDFPFLYVQIAPFLYSGDVGQAALLRDAQRKTLTLNQTGMASTMDIGNPVDIHPKNKWDVGHRLALWARALCYGEKDVDVSGPLYRSMTVEGSALRIEFDYAEEGFMAVDGPLTHFQVAGRDHEFHEAQATIDGATVVVQSEEVPAPVAVRFAWGAGDQPNLADAHGLPASSFRTDDWGE